jgi:hypothetical protein
MRGVVHYRYLVTYGVGFHKITQTESKQGYKEQNASKVLKLVGLRNWIASAKPSGLEKPLLAGTEVQEFNSSHQLLFASYQVSLRYVIPTEGER